MNKNIVIGLLTLLVCALVVFSKITADEAKNAWITLQEEKSKNAQIMVQAANFRIEAEKAAAEAKRHAFLAWEAENECEKSKK